MHYFKIVLLTICQTEELISFVQTEKELTIFSKGQMDKRRINSRKL